MQRPIKSVGCADEAEVSEGLREVAEVLAFGAERFRWRRNAAEHDLASSKIEVDSRRCLW